MHKTSPKQLSSIQAMRGLAAFLVLVFHIYELQRLANGGSSAGLMQGPWAQGYAGVDVFFVISGFIIVYITDGVSGGARSVAKFIYNRISRIYPLWWLLCTILMAYYVVTSGRVFSPDYVGQVTSVSGYLAKSFLLIPQDLAPLIGQGWTLIHEMYFYAVFAVLLFLPQRFRYVGLIVWGALSLGLFALGYARPEAGNYVQLAASLLTLEFLCGAGVALLILRGINILPRISLWLGAISFILALCFYTDRGDDLMIWGRVIVYTLPICLIIYGAVILERENALSFSKLFTRLGDWSYSLYLSHLLVLGVIVRIMPKLSPSLSLDQPGMWDNLVFIALGLVLSLLCAVVLFYGFERPLLRAMRPAKKA